MIAFKLNQLNCDVQLHLRSKKNNDKWFHVQQNVPRNWIVTSLICILLHNSIV